MSEEVVASYVIQGPLDVPNYARQNKTVIEEVLSRQITSILFQTVRKLYAEGYMTGEYHVDLSPMIVSEDRSGVKAYRLTARVFRKQDSSSRFGWVVPEERAEERPERRPEAVLDLADKKNRHEITQG